MVIFFPTKSSYKKGEDFPVMSIPTDMQGSNEMDLNDFQWWAYSKDFKEWLDSNPRSWVADSLNYTDWDSVVQMIKENQSKRLLSNKLNERVLNFSEYVLNEADPEPSSGKDVESGDCIKLTYAYNQLITDKKIDSDFTPSDVKEGDSKSVFVCMEDPKTGKNVMETLTSLKLTPRGAGSGSRIILFDVTETIPGGALPEETSSEGLMDQIVSTGKKVAIAGAAGLALYGGISAAGSIGGLYALNKIRKTVVKSAVKKFTGDAAKEALIRQMAKTAGTGARIGKVYNPATLEESAGFFKNFVKTGKGSIGTFFKTPINASLALGRGVGGAVQAVKSGESAIGGFKTAFNASKLAAEFNPWTALVQAVLSGQQLWNWFSDNQAPKYKEISQFGHDSFKPKDIEIGVPITVCWTQEAGGVWGALSWVGLKNDTRTTMEIVKIAETKGDSIFVLLQVNSKEIGKQLSEHDLTLVSFKNSANFEHGILDNDDLELRLKSVDLPKNLASIYNLMGVCSWEECEAAFQKASPNILASDDAAPSEYSFYFKDTEDNVINVSGSKVTTEDLSKYTDDDIEKIFHISKTTNEIGPIEGGESTEAPEASNENLDAKKDLLWGQVKTFSDFSSILEAGDVKSVEDNEESSDKAQDNELILTPDQQLGPAKLAIYKVTEKEYADPELRGKYFPGNFTNFTVHTNDYKAAKNSPILVEINTMEEIYDPKAGTYTFKQEKELKDKEVKKNVQPVIQDEDGEKTKKDSGEDEKEEDTYHVKVKPNDVVIKNKKSSSVIRDNPVSGGLNLFDKFLTPSDKSVLKIDDWKAVTFAKEKYDKAGNPIEVIFRNKYAPFGDRKRRYNASDGEAFEVAKRFVEDTKDRVEYE